MAKINQMTLRLYWAHLKRYSGLGTVMFLATIFASLISIIVPIYFKKFFDILGENNLDKTAGDALIKILIIITIWELASWAFWRISTFSASRFQAKVIADLSNTCFQYIHHHSFSFFSNNFVGSLVKKVNRFTRSFEGVADRIIYDILQLIVKVIAILAVLFVTNLELGIGLTIWIVVFLLVNWFFIRYKLRYDLERSKADSKLTGILADTITNHLNVKLFNGYKKECGNYGEANAELTKLRLFTWNLGNWFEAAQGFLTIVLEMGLFYVGIRLWQVGRFTVGDFFLLQSYIFVVILSIWNFGRVLQRIYEDLAEAEEMTEVLNTPHEIVDAPDAAKLEVKKGEIEFFKVDFNYHETRTILKNFNLHIAPGEKIALVGPSGAGKTTVVKLLLHLYELSGGQILIDKQRIDKVALESLWQNVSLVPQDPILFHRTLKENIRYGKFKATDKDVVEAAKMAYCHDFITGLSEGYDTYVGERGVKLSGGERQRVAIARAILRNAPILVLDEATSSLDSGSEQEIQRGLENLIKNKTVIVIAHRLSTIMKMDRIVVIDQGGAVESGTHSELLKKRGGLYKKLWHLQAGGFIK